MGGGDGTIALTDARIRFKGGALPKGGIISFHEHAPPPMSEVVRLLHDPLERRIVIPSSSTAASDASACCWSRAATSKVGRGGGKGCGGARELSLGRRGRRVRRVAWACCSLASSHRTWGLAASLPRKVCMSPLTPHPPARNSCPSEAVPSGTSPAGHWGRPETGDEEEEGAACEREGRSC